MSKIIACVSNISSEDIESLWAMITYYGGSFRLSLDSECTHLISTKPEGEKYEKALSTNEKIKIVTPDWVVNCIKSKNICDEELYHPKLLILQNSAPITTDSSMPIETETKTEAFTTEASTTSVTTSTTQVTLRTVSLPPSTLITTVPVSAASQISTQQRRQIRLLLSPNSQETSDSTTQQQCIQPRQVYLTLQQQPPIRPQQFNFIQIRQQQIPRAQGDIQVPVKPIILQQRIQPPVQLLPQQQQSHVQIQSQSQQQQQQQQGQPQQQQQQPQQHQSNQTSNQMQPSVQPMLNVFRQNAPTIVPKINQGQNSQDMPQPNQVRLAQGQQLIQVQRQMSPMHQRPSTHAQMQGNAGQMMRMPQQSAQYSVSQPLNQDQIIHDIQQQQQPPIRMIQGQQLIHLQRPGQQQISNNISPNNQQIIRGSSQIIFHQQNANISPHQRANMAPNHQVHIYFLLFFKVV